MLDPLEGEDLKHEETGGKAERQYLANCSRAAHLVWHDAKPGDRLTVHFTVPKEGRFTHEETGRRRRKRLLYVVSKVRRTPDEIRELYRKRFGIEKSYRQMNEAKIKTCTREPGLRLLFVGIALVLRNVWVWIHFRFAKRKYSAEPQLFLELLRFQEMLLWIAQIVQQALGADKTLDSIVIPTNDLRHIAGYSQTWNY